MSRRGANGDKAYFIDERDGLRKPYRKLRKDGYTKGLKVTKENYDPPHPQEKPLRNLNDPQSLKNATGDVDRKVQFLNVSMREFKNQVGELAAPIRCMISLNLTDKNVVLL